VLAGLLREFPDTRAWISFSCRDGEHNCAGENMGACAAELHDHPQIAALGVNCTAPQHVISLLRTMRQATDKPLAIYPNSGECYDAAAKQWSGDRGAIQMGEKALQWYAEGARLIGGCCRTGPRDIRAVKQCVHPAHCA
jgi:homocysteine S-methyltransferase